MFSSALSYFGLGSARENVEEDQPHQSPYIWTIPVHMQNYRRSLKVVIRGAREVGKTSLMHRLRGDPIPHEYAPSIAITATCIKWIPLDVQTSSTSSSSTPAVAAAGAGLASKLNGKGGGDDNSFVRMDVWDVVDKGVPLAPANTQGNKLIKEGPRDLPHLPLDATTIDVYQHCHCVLFLFDVTKRETFKYVQSEARKVPQDKCIVVCANFLDRMSDVSPNECVQEEEIVELCKSLQRAGTPFVHSLTKSKPDPAVTVPASCIPMCLATGFGLRALYQWFNIPYSLLQAREMEEKLTAQYTQINQCCLEQETLFSTKYNYRAFELASNPNPMMAMRGATQSREHQHATATAAAATSSHAAGAQQHEEYDSMSSENSAQGGGDGGGGRNSHTSSRSRGNGAKGRGGKGSADSPTTTAAAPKGLLTQHREVISRNALPSSAARQGEDWETFFADVVLSEAEEGKGEGSSGAKRITKHKKPAKKHKSPKTTDGNASPDEKKQTAETDVTTTENPNGDETHEGDLNEEETDEEDEEETVEEGAEDVPLAESKKGKKAAKRRCRKLSSTRQPEALDSLQQRRQQQQQQQQQRNDGTLMENDGGESAVANVEVSGEVKEVLEAAVAEISSMAQQPIEEEDDDNDGADADGDAAVGEVDSNSGGKHRGQKSSRGSGRSRRQHSNASSSKAK